MKVNIVVEYKQAENFLYSWAFEEKYIDFRKEPERAARCTMAFAATELIHYLTLLSHETTWSDSNRPDVYNVVLKAEELGDGEEYSFIPKEYGLCILGTGRVGVLYGAYDFLKMQNICWLNPWEEVLPEECGDLIFPQKESHAKPSFPMGRGFKFEGPLKESKKLFLWMARNKMNLSTYGEHTAKFQKKLGMIFKQGGHIFERILDPDKALPSGKTIWEEHPEWYGLPKTGIRKKDTALKTQFCMSNEELLAYLSEELLWALQNEWAYADRVDVLLFDTWGNCCQCDKCLSLGNTSDQSIYFMSYLRRYLDKALEEGKLDRKVNLVFGAYEGTSTIEPPLNGVPENLRVSGDYFNFSPILRCYEHKIDEEVCEHNQFYNKILADWCNIPDGIPMAVGEYYNVTRFEDIPFLFTRTMAQDIKHYYHLGVQCLTYMHLPMLHWGVRNHTQLIFAELCWDKDADIEALEKKYYRARYGIYAEKVKEAYSYIEEAGKNCFSWRGWGKKSILTNLNKWDGGSPKETLYRDDHLGEQAAALGMASVACYEKAINILEEELSHAEAAYMQNMNFAAKIAVNPNDIYLKPSGNVYGERLREDLIYVAYGKDCMDLMTQFILYHEALEQNKEDKVIFERIDVLAGRMQRYYIPLKYEMRDADINCLTALKRSQLENLYYRCKAKRGLQ